MLRGVGVDAQQPGPGDGDALHRDQLDHRVAVGGDEARTGGLHLLGEAGGRLETRIVNGSWKYTGEVDGLLAANRMVLDELESDVGGCDLSQARIEGRVQIHPTAVIERSTIRGPAVIGAGAGGGGVCERFKSSIRE